MDLNKYRNEPCHCGKTEEKVVWENDIESGTAKQIRKQIPVKFKHCHLRLHNEQRAQVVTALAKREVKKEREYWKKRYEQLTDKGGTE